VSVFRDAIDVFEDEGKLGRYFRSRRGAPSLDEGGKVDRMVRDT